MDDRVSPAAETDGADEYASRPLDTAAVAGIEGLAQETAMLRAAIRRLAEGGDAARDVRILAELRHQVGALCTALKTQHDLEGSLADDLTVELARALEELGDTVGVPR